MIPPINQNNAITDEENGGSPVGEMAIGMNTYLVTELKGECDRCAASASKEHGLQWILVAIGTSLLVLEGCFFLAAFAFSHLFCLQIGLYLIPPSVLCLSLIPLFAPIDYEKIKGLVDRDLVEFAQTEDRSDLSIASQGRIQLNPGNIPIYHEVKRLADKRKSEEDAKNK